VKLYLLAVTEVVCLDKTNCIKVPAFLFLSLKSKEVMDDVIVAVDCIRQRGQAGDSFNVLCKVPIWNMTISSATWQWDG